MSACSENCKSYILTNGSLSVDVTVEYKNCDSGSTTTHLVTAGNSYNFCACDENAITITPPDVEGVTGPTDLGPCSNQYVLNYSTVSPNDACAGYDEACVNCSTYYTQGYALLMDGVSIYTDPTLTSLAPNGYYSNGVKAWTIAANSGVLNQEELCAITPTPTPTVTPTITPTISETPTPTPTISVTPTITPTISETPTPTPTISVTPTNTMTPTPTISVTPTNTPTPTVTPTTSMLACKWFSAKRDLNNLGCVFLCENQTSFQKIYGRYDTFNGSIGARYFTAEEYCENNTPNSWGIEGEFRFLKDGICYGVDSNGYITGTTSCIAPTPSVTPSPVFQQENECGVFTVFPMGVSCLPTNPTASDSLDGSIKLIVTGGTTPYSFYWSNGQRTDSLNNMGPGTYTATVVDYYGDFSATTTCTLIGPTPTPTPTTTPTTTPTPSVNFPSLCLYVIGDNIQTIKRQFVFSGFMNNKPKWSYSGNTNILYWKTNRWEISGLTVFNGILVSNTTSNIPDNGWYIAGGDSTASVLVQRGVCSNVPLSFGVQRTNTKCNNTINCNGVLNINAFGGSPPYAYSINNGLSYQQASFFNGLCQGTYVVSVLDSSGATNNGIFTLGYDSSGTSYTASIKLLDSKTINQETKEIKWLLELNPKPIAGTNVSLNIDLNTIGRIYEPGSGTTTVTNTIYKNNVVVSATSVTTTTNSLLRPNCFPFLVRETLQTKRYGVTFGNNDVISGITTSNIKITNPQIGSNGCPTFITQDTFVSLSSLRYSACSCCNIVWDNNPVRIEKHEISYLNVSLPSVGIKYPFTVIVGNSINAVTTGSTTTIYANAPFFTTNITVYGNQTDILTGYQYISYNGTIYTINNTTGVVGSPLSTPTPTPTPTVTPTPI